VHTGTICDFDANDQYGLIDTDDGRLIPFNLRNVEPPLRDAFEIGARVKFVEQSGIPSPRALALTLVPPPTQLPGCAESENGNCSKPVAATELNPGKARLMSSATELLKQALQASSTATVIFERFPSHPQNACVNASFEALTGFNADALSSTGLEFLHGAETDPQSILRLRAAVAEGSELRLAMLSYRMDGRHFWNLLHIIPLRDGNGASTHYIGMLNDVTEERRRAERLEYLALHDPLTGLPNRHLLYNRLDQQLTKAQQEHCSFALVLVDINDFKQINDRFGHDFGDQLLELFGARLNSCVTPDDTVCRYGGDEFVLLLREEAANIGFAWIKGRIDHAMQRPLVVGGYHIDVSCSVGVSVYPADGVDRPTLFRKADMEMYANKAARCGTSSLHTSASPGSESWPPGCVNVSHPLSGRPWQREYLRDNFPAFP
jgi:diguanylate cyclase (GGDEF)-like protein/PAS domain S-box-containing protein